MTIYPLAGPHSFNLQNQFIAIESSWPAALFISSRPAYHLALASSLSSRLSLTVTCCWLLSSVYCPETFLLSSSIGLAGNLACLSVNFAPKLIMGSSDWHSPTPTETNATCRTTNKQEILHNIKPNQTNKIVSPLARSKYLHLFTFYFFLVIRVVGKIHEMTSLLFLVN